MQFILNHPWLLSLLGLPAILAAIPLALQKFEVSALKSLFRFGDSADQKAMKGIVKVLVQWAEDKYSEGAVKFDVVDAIVARALPFLTVEQRKQLIEDSVKDLDAGASEAINS
jgi:hypothetical protein